MRCEKTGCPHDATVKVDYGGSVRWSACLCQACIDEFWRDARGLCAAGVADVTFTPVEDKP